MNALEPILTLFSLNIWYKKHTLRGHSKSKFVRRGERGRGTAKSEPNPYFTWYFFLYKKRSKEGGGGYVVICERKYFWMAPHAILSTHTTIRESLQISQSLSKIPVKGCAISLIHLPLFTTPTYTLRFRLEPPWFLNQWYVYRLIIFTNICGHSLTIPGIRILRSTSS